MPAEMHASSVAIPGRHIRTEPAERAMVGRGVRAWSVAIWGITFSTFLLYALLFRQTYVDDAYITLQYARNLSEHLTWGFFADHPSNTATSPLNVMLLALIDRIVPGSTEVAVAPYTAGLWTGMLAVLLQLSRRVTGEPLFGLIAAVGLITNPLLLSTIGLESMLFVFLMLVALWLMVEQRPGPLGVALGLLVLSRPDGILLAGLVILLLPGGWPRRVTAGSALVVTVLPWYLFSWLYLGSVVPDSLIIKLDQRAWGPTTFRDGFDLYRDRFEIATIGSLWPIVLSPFALLWLWRSPGIVRRVGIALIGATVAHAAGYTILDVPPYHWYYTQEVATIVLLSALGLAALLRGLISSPHLPDRAAAFAASLLPSVGLAYLVLFASDPFDSAPITTNWATPAEYREIGLELRELVGPSDVVELKGEIGTIAYFCECYVVDVFADPNRTGALIADMRADADGLTSLLLDANFTWWSEEPALPLPKYTLDSVPVLPGKSPPIPGPATVSHWDVSSPWITGERRVVLERTGYLSITVSAESVANGAAPPLLQGAYEVVPVGVDPSLRLATGAWTADQMTLQRVEAYVTVIVRIRHPAYEDFEVSVMPKQGVTEIAATLVPRPPPPELPSGTASAWQQLGIAAEDDARQSHR